MDIKIITEDKTIPIHMLEIRGISPELLRQKLAFNGYKIMMNGSLMTTQWARDEVLNLAEKYAYIAVVLRTRKKHERVIPTKKPCSRCGIVKPLSEFNKNKMRYDGRLPECKECEKVRHKLYREKNKDKINAYRASRRVQNRAYSKKYYIEHRDEILAKNKAYRERKRAEGE